MPRRKQIVGVAWYRARDWNRLRQICADPEALEESHGEWLRTANRILREVEKRDGVRMRKVIVDLDELVEFCHREGIALDAKARSRFVAEKLEVEEAGASDETK